MIYIKKLYFKAELGNSVHDYYSMINIILLIDYKVYNISGYNRIKNVIFTC